MSNYLKQVGEAIQATVLGVNIIEALTDLRDTVENPGFRQVVASLLEDIEGGLKLSEAMANHCYCFDGVFVSLVRAGEQSGAADRGARRALREPQVAGRDGQPGQEGDDLSPDRAGGDRGRDLRADDGARPAARRDLQDAGAEAAARDRDLIMLSDVFVRWWYLLLGVPALVVGGGLDLPRTNERLAARRRRAGAEAAGARASSPEDHPRAVLDLLRHALPRRASACSTASTSARRSWATA